MTVTHWLYPTNPASEYVLVDPVTGEETAVSPHELHRQIEEHPDRIDPWHLSTGYKLMRAGDLVWIYAAGKDQAIVAMARALQIYMDSSGWHVDLAWDLETTRRLSEEPIPRAQYGQIAQRVRSGNSADAICPSEVARHQ